MPMIIHILPVTGVKNVVRRDALIFNTSGRIDEVITMLDAMGKIPRATGESITVGAGASVFTQSNPMIVSVIGLANFFNNMIDRATTNDSAFQQLLQTPMTDKCYVIFQTIP